MIERSGFRLWVPGTPRPGGRPKFSTRNGKPNTRPDEKDKPAKTAITIAWMRAGRPKLEGAYGALLHVEVPRKPSHWTSAGELGAAGHRAKLPQGDVDNYAKLALDALVKCGALPDDQLCKTLLVEKDWADGRDHPGLLTIEIQPRSSARSDSMPAIAWAQIDAGDTPAAAA